MNWPCRLERKLQKLKLSVSVERGNLLCCIYTCTVLDALYFSAPTGAEGNVDGSLQLMKEVEEVKLKKKEVEDEYHALIPRHAVQQQKLKACEVRETCLCSQEPETKQ